MDIECLKILEDLLEDGINDKVFDNLDHELRGDYIISRR